MNDRLDICHSIFGQGGFHMDGTRTVCRHPPVHSIHQCIHRIAWRKATLEQRSLLHILLRRSLRSTRVYQCQKALPEIVMIFPKVSQGWRFMDKTSVSDGTRTRTCPFRAPCSIPYTMLAFAFLRA
ncbi:unnamed protein product [Haemonchus placei]|uniref:Uncharacterized protein n=1 Tax=Haemonchus placei TaxID=6290 RepID=A0A0N4WWZ8_HAEPC|nr:unnamed protein product [Haemonchus placei]